MKRFGLILAASWIMTATVAEAGELDAEYGGKALAVREAKVADKPSSELDAESPTQTCCLKRRLCGYGYGGYGYGYGRGCCLIGYGGFGGYGFYGGYGGFGYGGFGGYGGGFGYGGFGGYGGGFW
jgi:hypothetical protein